MSQKAIIIGAGPAGLTAAYELLKRTDIKPIILEKSGDIGGISKTVNYKGNRIDIGGHRFFSKSDRVMQWWMNIMPLETNSDDDPLITYQGKTRKINGTNYKAADADPDRVMLIRRRLSRIYFLRKFFTYPIQLSFDTLKKLGLLRTIGIMFSYLWARLFPRRSEKSLEDFFINRFGRKLYLLFFKDYTEKVWGVSCKSISAEWGAQRIKGISIGKAVAHAVTSLQTRSKEPSGDIHQKGVETSLIERFLYPKYGPGQLWEEVARQIKEMGGEIRMNCEVRTIRTANGKITGVASADRSTGEMMNFEGDYFFSTMPVKELVANLDAPVPEKVKEIAAGLQYRDFITVGVLLRQLTTSDLKDTWIYIQEKDVKVGRLQLFNNWSPYMVQDPANCWIGMEYFCNDWDAFWSQPDEVIKDQAIGELEKMGLAAREDVLDATVLRMEKTYPAYFGTYHQFDHLRNYLDSYNNLFLIGRNGMHKYNNSDHSMLTAMVAVDNISAGVIQKENIWAINTEQEYHEEKASDLTNSATKDAGRPAPVHPGSTPGGISEFLIGDRRKRALLWLSICSIVLQFVLFKILYPQAEFINADSYSYIQAAYRNSSINTYPVGYSNFLRLFSVFSNSDTALVASQYLLLQGAVLYLLLTLTHIYKPEKLTRFILFVLTIYNPLWLYLANYISSDALFTALSIVWFTLLIWMVERFTIRTLITQVILLFLLFTIRYNALYYPLILAIALLLSRQRLLIQLTGISATILVIFAFIWHTSSKYNDLTGIRQFSPFSGWQIANNALYFYRYVDSADIKPVPDKFQQLDKRVRHYFDTTRDWLKHPQELVLANTYYMWDPGSPLQLYMKQRFERDSAAATLKKWATVGPLYGEYGSFLMRQYPLLFVKYCLWPNAQKYYAPPAEFLGMYNMDRDTVAEIARSWFHYKNKRIQRAPAGLKATATAPFPVFFGAVNVAFLFCLLFFGMLHGFKTPLSKMALLTGSFWAVNFGFSVFASPTALRFQTFPMLIFFSFTTLLAEYIFKLASIRSEVDLKSSRQDLAKVH
jgi:protoporphyrinogen oxidase